MVLWLPCSIGSRAAVNKRHWYKGTITKSVFCTITKNTKTYTKHLINKYKNINADDIKITIT